jgi:hypothetical protein
VNAVTAAVSAVQPAAPRFRQISTAMLGRSLPATEPKTCRPPSDVSTLPGANLQIPFATVTATESTVTVIADEVAIGLTAAGSCSPILSVWLRKVSWFLRSRPARESPAR